MITLSLLLAVMPHCPRARAELFLPHLQWASAEAGITTPEREAAWLAQLAHESGELRYMEEIASGAAYEGRLNLGNTQPGDGQRYKGRGPIQLTGRANYRAAGAELGLDLEANPDQVARPDVGFRTAAWYWRTHGCNELADRLDFEGLTRAINGGLNGLAERDRYWAVARKALGLW